MSINTYCYPSQIPEKNSKETKAISELLTRILTCDATSNYNDELTLDSVSPEDTLNIQHSEITFQNRLIEITVTGILSDELHTSHSFAFFCRLDGENDVILQYRKSVGSDNLTITLSNLEHHGLDLLFEMKLFTRTTQHEAGHFASGKGYFFLSSPGNISVH